jgi:hypothetical protein
LYTYNGIRSPHGSWCFGGRVTRTPRISIYAKPDDDVSSTATAASEFVSQMLARLHPPHDRATLPTPYLIRSVVHTSHWPSKILRPPTHAPHLPTLLRFVFLSYYVERLRAAVRVGSCHAETRWPLKILLNMIKRNVWQKL